MKLTDVLPILDDLTPLRYAESWDNVGLLVGDPAAEIRRVLVTVDYASELVAEEARAAETDLVVAYHPPMFAAVKRVPHGALWADAVRRGIALYSMHTALDVAPGGTNDFLADACGVVVGDRRSALRPFVSKVAEPAGIGLGRVGEVISRTTLRDLIARLKPTLGLGHVLVAGDLGASIERVAVAAGAGGELLPDAIRAKVDVFVTGEVRHHDAIAANLQRVAVVAMLHSNSERAAVRSYAARLAARLPGVVVTSSQRDADPFVVA